MQVAVIFLYEFMCTFLYKCVAAVWTLEGRYMGTHKFIQQKESMSKEEFIKIHKKKDVLLAQGSPELYQIDSLNWRGKKIYYKLFNFDERLYAPGIENIRKGLDWQPQWNANINSALIRFGRATHLNVLSRQHIGHVLSKLVTLSIHQQPSVV